VAGATLKFAVSGTGNTLSPSTGIVTTGSDGSWSGSFVSTVAATKTISATGNGIAITQTASCVVSTTNDVTSITSISPTSGSDAGGTPVTATVVGATGTPSVTVGGVAATSVVVVSSTSITFVTPASGVGDTAADVVIGTKTKSGAFTYTAAGSAAFTNPFDTSVALSSGGYSTYQRDESPGSNLITIANDSGLDSTYRAKCRYGLLPTYANAMTELGFTCMPGGAYLPELWFEWDWLVPSNFYHPWNNGQNNNKLFVLWHQNYSNTAEVQFSCEFLPQAARDGTSRLKPYFRQPSAPTWQDAYNTTAKVFNVYNFIGPGCCCVPGTITNIRVHCKPASGIGNNDGVFEFWAGGTLMYQKLDGNIIGSAGTSTASFGYAYIMGAANSDYASETDFYVANLKFYTSNPW